jgi:hypothetical protein
LEWTLNKERGLAPRCLEYVFARLGEMRQTSAHMDYRVECTCFEVVNELVIDLVLCCSSQLGNFPSLPQLKEDVFKAPYLEGITTITTTSILETLSVLNIGIAKRHQSKAGSRHSGGLTDMVFSLRIKCMVGIDSSQFLEEGKAFTRIAKLHFVDFTGSNSISKVEASVASLPQNTGPSYSYYVLKKVIQDLNKVRLD